MSAPSPPGLVESPEAVRSFRERLLDFFDEHARDLPWRRTSDPYAIWVSEIMAQQTRVETVVPYYLRWLERFPDVNALAAAPVDAVLKEWEGLGYYSRARNLHRAAGIVAETLGGKVPDTVDGLRALPGVGEYASGAIASIAFDRSAPAVDGNVRRVFARLHDDPAPSTRAVREWAGRVVDPERPGDFNQALMELGATVCTPKRARCGDCPVVAFCAAHAAGTVDDRPAPKRRTRVRTEERVVLVVVAGSAAARSGDDASAATGSLLVRQRPAEGLLAGMWEFPSMAVRASSSDRAVRRALRELVRSAGLDIELRGRAPLEPVAHRFSHLHVTYRPWLLAIGDSEPPPLADGHRWLAAAADSEVALPVAQQRIAALARCG